VLGALVLCGADRRLTWTCRASKVDSAAVLDSVWREGGRSPASPERLPAGYRRARPRVVVKGNASAHGGRAVKDQP